MKRSLDAADGTRLALREWPSPAAPRATLVLVHGLGEHLGRHRHVAEALQAHDIRVVAYDQRGHGESAGARGRMDRDGALLDDLAAVVDHARAEMSAATPLLLLGHSLGGLVAARFVAGALETPQPAWARDVDALALSSPALALGLGTAQRLLLATLSRLAPDLAIGNGLDARQLSRDAGVVAAYRGDPRVHDRVSARLVRFMLDAGRRVRAAAPAWRVPTLVLWAGADRIVDPAGSDRFVAAAPRDVVQGRRLDALRHEIFNEPERAEVLSALTSWLDKLPLPPATESPP